MRYCFALDLKNDPVLIAEYEHYHEAIWPEIRQSMYDAGITVMEIYRIENRMVLLMDTADDFSLERKAEMDAANPKVQEWEALMWRYQEALPYAEPGQKWLPMKRIFVL
ncbi:L-rhamnose mutarotase [Spirosoma utsteinense]|uniref:L-rhamnose mutarotase n=1 Tax=Spirosoma utsteinense TaxID=2585773 RepID=A0ABR6W7V3_9BACT|nr:L-rhamnose mutarotase [Spirosoma utsteinense]MBC3787730.1 L-rhamnose mutarotase [Spirosoma utsteinense]MBC3792666.1 L-rhamnose mutarotase [Spirosoma utsteinense]